MIELKNLNKRFGDKLAVQDMNMVIKPGEVMGLIGQNGAGKTTTFRMVLDFIEPTSGEITWDGHKITSADKQRIGFLPEERGLYQKLTIEEQVMYFAELHGMKRADAKASLQDWMKRLDVVGKTTDKVQKLSKGNAQKVQLISTVIFHPEFLILDEPFTGLDPATKQTVIDLINELCSGKLLITSTHAKEDAVLLNAKIILL